MHYIHHTLHRFSEYKPSGGNVFSNLQPNWQLEFVIEFRKGLGRQYVDTALSKPFSILS